MKGYYTNYQSILTIHKKHKVSSDKYRNADIELVRRSRLEIYFDVLKAIDNGTNKPTRIMYETNLSWTSVCSVFDALLNSDFIGAEKKKNSTRYYITEKGKNALTYHIRSLEDLIQYT